MYKSSISLMFILIMFVNITVDQNGGVYFLFYFFYYYFVVIIIVVFRELVVIMLTPLQNISF
jgi:hypothetical protein